jgi:hypothetical protein
MIWVYFTYECTSMDSTHTYLYPVYPMGRGFCPLIYLRIKEHLTPALISSKTYWIFEFWVPIVISNLQLPKSHFFTILLIILNPKL